MLSLLSAIGMNISGGIKPRVGGSQQQQGFTQSADRPVCSPEAGKPESSLRWMAPAKSRSKPLAFPDFGVNAGNVKWNDYDWCFCQCHRMLGLLEQFFRSPHTIFRVERNPDRRIDWNDDLWFRAVRLLWAMIQRKAATAGCSPAHWNESVQIDPCQTTGCETESLSTFRRSAKGLQDGIANAVAILIIDGGKVVNTDAEYREFLVADEASSMAPCR